MDFWAIVMVIATLTGVLGWGFNNVFVNVVWWYCEWRDGNDPAYVSDVAWTFVVPFAWLFAIFEICALYCK